MRILKIEVDCNSGIFKNENAHQDILNSIYKMVEEKEEESNEDFFNEDLSNELEELQMLHKYLCNEDNFNTLKKLILNSE